MAGSGFLSLEIFDLLREITFKKAYSSSKHSEIRFTHRPITRPHLHSVFGILRRFLRTCFLLIQLFFRFRKKIFQKALDKDEKSLYNVPVR